MTFHGKPLNGPLVVSISAAEMAVLFAPDSLLRIVLAVDPDLSGHILPFAATDESGWMLFFFEPSFGPLLEGQATHRIEQQLLEGIFAHANPPPVAEAAIVR